MSEQTVLQTIGLSKSFGGIVVTDNVDFSLSRGERRALIGPNGAGKTTFLNLIAGRLRPDAGSVHLMGSDVSRINESRRVTLGIGRTFQINNLFGELTVFENVFLAASQQTGNAWSLLGRAGRDRATVDIVDHFVSRLGLGPFAAVPVRQLGYGQQRLTEIAIALALKPKVLLLDEPAAGVPSGESAKILEAVAALPKDIAVLLVDHDMDLVFQFAERITVLCQGRLLTEGSPREISNSEQVRDVYLGSRKSIHA